MKIILISLVILTLIFNIVSLTNSHWTNDGTTHTGLWQTCTTSCKFNSVSDSIINSIRGLAILNAILSLLCLYWVFNEGLWHLRIYSIAILIINISNMSMFAKWKKNQKTLTDAGLTTDYYINIGSIITSILTLGLSFKK